MALNQLSKSQRIIRHAFLEMLNQKSFNKITVTEIICKADLGRSTFYAHYEDKYQLLEEIENELISGLIDLMLDLRDKGSSAFEADLLSGLCPTYVEFFKYIRKHSFEFSTLLNYKSETFFSEKLTAKIASTRHETIRLWMEQSEYHYFSDHALNDYRDSVLSSCYVSMFTTWLRRGMDFNEEQMGTLLTSTWSSMWRTDAIFKDLNMFVSPISAEVKP